MIPFRRLYPKVGLSKLQRDPNCVLVQDPSAFWGSEDHLPRRNLLVATAIMATQNVAVKAEPHVLYAKGTGSVALSGTGSGTLNGTGASNRVSLAFTPTTGTCTFTVTGSITEAHLTLANTVDHSYQAITDWTTEQYIWNTTKNVPWLRRNLLTNTPFATGLGRSLVTYTTTTEVTPPTEVSTETVAKISVDGNTGVHHLYCAQAIAANTANGANTRFTVFLKGHDGDALVTRLGVQEYTGSAKYCFFRANDGVISATTFTQSPTVTNAGDGWWKISAITPVVSTGSRFVINLVANTSATFAGNGSSYIYACAPLQIIEPPGGGTSTSFQRVDASWDATYTALAQAAGYPISMYSTRTGNTAAVSVPDTVIGQYLDKSGKNNHSAAPTDAARPILRLDGNGKYYIQRDLSDDNLPITFANLGNNCSTFVCENATTVTEATAQTINSTINFTTPATDYGRVIVTQSPSYRTKLIAYLKRKAGG